MKLTEFFHFLSPLQWPRWLRRKLKLRPKLQQALAGVALATAVVVGCFLCGPPEVSAQTIYIENGRNPNGSGGYDNVGNWYDGTAGTNIVDAINNNTSVIIRDGSNVLWNGHNTYGASNFTTNNNVTVQNNSSNTTFGFGNISKTGAGILTFQNGTWNNSGAFSGTAGGITLNNSTFNTTGLASVNNFTFNTGTGTSWNAQGDLNATGNFTKSGAGNLAVSGYSTITGSGNVLAAGNWTSTTGVRLGSGTTAGNLSINFGASLGTSANRSALTVGYGTSGTASTLTNNSGGSLYTSTSNIGNTSQGSVDNSGTWNGSGAAQVGGTATGATGTVTNRTGGSWTNAGQVTVGGSGQNATGQVTNTGQMDWTSGTATQIGGTGTGATGTVNNNAGGTWTNTADTRIGGTNGHGTVSNAGTWANTGLVSVGYGAAGGDVTNTGTMNWNNTGQSEVGVSGSGSVNNSGAWTNRGSLRIGGTANGATGTVTNSGTGVNGWTNDGQVTVGGTATNATGTVTNTGRMDWTSNQATRIGGSANGATGTVNNTGSNAVWTNSNSAVIVSGTVAGATGTVVNDGGTLDWDSGELTEVGEEASGSVTNKNGGQWNNTGDTRVGGTAAGATGTVDNEIGSTWTNDGQVTVGGTFNNIITNPTPPPATIPGPSADNATGTVNNAGTLNWNSNQATRIGGSGYGATGRVNNTGIWNNHNSAVIVSGTVAGATGTVDNNGGTLNWDSGELTEIGEATNGSVTNRNGGTWNNTGDTRVGGTSPNATGTVNNQTGSTWTNDGKVTVGGSASGTTGTVTNDGTSTMEWKNAADSLIGQTGAGTVTSSGTWNTWNNVIVGAGPGGGTVNINGGTWRVGPTGNLDVVVGQGGTGRVNQTAGTWTNRFTDVGHGATGTVVQRGDTTATITHNDQYAYIGNTSTGTYTLGGGAGNAIWNTQSTDPTYGVGAVIGVTGNASGGVTGRTNVANRGTWTITDALTVGERGQGYLDISNYSTDANGNLTTNAGNTNGGIVNVGDDMIIGHIGSSSGPNIAASTGTVTVRGTGSQLNVAGDLTTGDQAGTGTNAQGARGGLFVSASGLVTVGGDHVIANEVGTQGRDQVDGNGSRLEVTGDMIVGNQGQAGSLPPYQSWPYNSASPYNGLPSPGAFPNDPATWFGSTNMGGPTWDVWPFAPADNAPGLAITRGGVVIVESDASAAVGANSTAYIVIDDKDATGTRSTWDVKGTLTLSDLGEAYTRVMNGGLLQTDDTLTMANLAGSLATLDVYGSSNIHGVSRLNVNNNDFIIANLGEATFNLFNGAHADVWSGDTYVAKQAGSKGTVNIWGGGVKTVHDGDMIIAQERNTIGNLNIWGAGSTLEITNGNLITGQDNGTGGATNFAQGNLYAWGGAHIHVGEDHVIADGINALGRDYIDEYGTTMTVDGTLMVGNHGQAGGTYTENSYDTRYANDPNGGIWFDGLNNNVFHSRDPLNSITNAKTGINTGNDPGLAITRGAHVYSDRGVVANSNNGMGTKIDTVTGLPVNGEPATSPGAWSNGYVVIDNKGNTAGPGAVFNPVAMTYDPFTNNPAPSAGTDPSRAFRWPSVTDYSSYASTWEVGHDLVIGNNGNAFVRVLNGGLLETGSAGNNANGASTIIAQGENPNEPDSGRGTLHVFGNDPTWGRSIWKSWGATVVGLGNLTRGTFRINDGAFGETAGLYLGAGTGSEGEVSVMGRNSMLHITAVDPTNAYAIDRTGAAPNTAANSPLGKGLFSASDDALIWMDANSEIRLDGIAEISTGTILHLDGIKELPVNPSHNTLQDPIFDMTNKRMTVTNARIEGIGTITGADGVHTRQDDTYTQYGQTEIDPGLVYGWATHCEKDYYGTLTFGHTLNMSGGEITYFDVNSGYDTSVPIAELPPWTGGSYDPEQDHIIVQGDPHNTTDQVRATLAGTLMLHARLTNYYAKDTDLRYDIVTTVGANGLKGLINREYDDLHVMPDRFFDNIQQFIEENAYGDDVLYVTMRRKDDPFSAAGQTYNQINTGRALDSIYALDDQRWLPILRYFWYLGDPDFLDAYKLWSGEVRAHSLLMPLQNPWTYANDRVGFSRCSGHVFFGPQNRSCNRVNSAGLWGTYIHSTNNTSSDGNAGDYSIRRNGFAVGYDRASQGGRSYVGLMFAYNRAELDTFMAGAKSDDFQFGLYHGANICDIWEWKNYLGMGFQNYDMNRNVGIALSYMQLQPSGVLQCITDPSAGALRSNFAGYTLAGSTELARPFYFGCGKRWTFRPYMGLDLTAVWQNAASESGDFTNSEVVALDYHSSSNVRVYARPGVSLERGGSNGNIRGGVSYSFLMGGNRYTNVNNRFQFAGDEFNIRGVNDGAGFVTWNAGGGVYLDKCKSSMLMLDYWALTGSHSVIHAAQLGYQKNF